jgi:hypothetical protein
MNYYNTEYITNVIKNIHMLFINNKYSFKLIKKIDDVKNEYNITYYKPTNFNDGYKFYIFNDFYFVGIPLKKCNYYYTTKFDNINNVYDYIKMHLFY